MGVRQSVWGGVSVCEEVERKIIPDILRPLNNERSGFYSFLLEEKSVCDVTV